MVLKIFEPRRLEGTKAHKVLSSSLPVFVALKKGNDNDTCRHVSKHATKAFKNQYQFLQRHLRNSGSVLKSESTNL